MFSIEQTNSEKSYESIETLIYPKLTTEFFDYDKNNTNILFLGGSVLDRNIFYLKKLDFIKSLKIYNLAKSAHTSLDSRYKYEYLLSKGYHFDYVVFYHGINETRANNIPDSLYKNDYSHYSFYWVTNIIFNKNSISSFFLRKTFLGFYILKKLLYFKKHTLVPKHSPYPNWIKYGKNIKTIDSFKKNLEFIVKMAKKDNATLIVPQFAYNIESDSLLKKNREKYGYKKKGTYPVEIWGNLQNVVNGIKAHNKVIENFKSSFSYIDTQKISEDNKNFIDICHFSVKGNHEFINLYKKIIFPKELYNEFK